MSHAETVLMDDALRPEQDLPYDADRSGSGKFTAADHAAAAQCPYFAIKYAIERLVGCLLIVPALPIILIVALAVRLTSCGWPIYRQQRLGLHGETFWVYKIRSMYINAEADGLARWCVKGDSRITPLGFWLRKLHLDELPQLLNVALGHMVLVGPRPERPGIAKRLSTVIDGYYDRLKVKPGITGLAQINLPPDETLADAMRKQVLDLHYIQHTNFWLDSRLIFATGLRMLGVRGQIPMRMMRLCRRDLVRSIGAESTPADQPLGASRANGTEYAAAESPELAFSFAMRNMNGSSEHEHLGSDSVTRRRPR